MKGYESPEIHVEELVKADVILSSDVEHFSSYVDPNPGDWGDPIIDPDDDIIW